MARTGPTNLLKRKLIKGLKKLSKDEQANIWERISEELSAPRRKMVEANISKINRNANEGEV
ncbi:MAG: 50S ribosomal protein L18e, partial [Fervidicoccus sp.]